MNANSTVKKEGGVFLLEQVGHTPIFTREQFSEEQREIALMVRNFCTETVLPACDQIEKRDKELSLQLLRQMGELGLLSIDVPEQYGGLDLDKTTSIIVAETMGYGRSSSFTTTYSVHSGIGMLPIVWFGNEKQKEKYLPRLASGEWVGAYALTEPSSGSDATAAKTSAILADDGKHYVLNGEKQFITNGGWANVHTLFAQVDGEKFTAFLVDMDTPGLEVGPEEHKLGVQGSSTVPLKLTNAEVPVENVLGEIGGGATIAFNVLNIGRLKLGASVLGGCKQIIGLSAKYALERRQFGQPIAHFDAIKGKIADMTILAYALDSIIYRTVGMIDDAIGELDRGADDFYLKMGEAMERFAIESSMVKILGSESLGRCADTGIQIYGGYGFIEEYSMARIYRDTRIDRIWEGTNEINRQIITGYFMRKGLLNEIPLRERIREIEPFLTSFESPSSDSPLARQMEIIEAGKVMALYVFNEALNEFGQDLRHEQQLGESIADCFMDLYMADSTLSRVNQTIESEEQTGVLVPIAQCLTAEVALRLLNRALTGLNDIYHGRLPEIVIGRLRQFQVRMLPTADVADLKRRIAEYVYSQKEYPFQ
ncbi:MAG: acyl-CoA dehydrogenase family protein [Candidatus Neomarinimicrobiota bacterium]